MTARIFPNDPPRRKRSRGKTLAVVLIVLAIVACLFGVVVNAISAGMGAADDAARTGRIGSALAEDTQAPGTAAPAAKRPGSTLTVKDVELKVKTTEKQCFGSAGCNVSYEVKAEWPADKIGDRACDVTYEVTGLDDPQINTLVIVDPTHYEHDTTETGQTPRSSSKLKAKATEVDCS